MIKNGEKIGEYNSSYEVADSLGLRQSAVCATANGIYKTTKGFNIEKIK